MACLLSLFPSRQDRPRARERQRGMVRSKPRILLLFTALASACNAFVPDYGVYPIEEIQTPLPQDLSTYKELAVRVLQPADAAFLDVAKQVAAGVVTGLQRSGMFRSVSAVAWDAPSTADLELSIRVLSVRDVSGSDRFWHAGSGATWVKTQTDVISTKSRKTLGSAVLGGTSATDVPKGTTAGAVRVAARTIVKFLEGTQRREAQS